MANVRKYGRVRPCIPNSKADLRWLRKAAKKRPRELGGKVKGGDPYELEK